MPDQQISSQRIRCGYESWKRSWYLETLIPDRPMYGYWAVLNRKLSNAAISRTPITTQMSRWWIADIDARTKTRKVSKHRWSTAQPLFWPFNPPTMRDHSNAMWITYTKGWRVGRDVVLSPMEGERHFDTNKFFNILVNIVHLRHIASKPPGILGTNHQLYVYFS